MWNCAAFLVAASMSVFSIYSSSTLTLYLRREKVTHVVAVVVAFLSAETGELNLDSRSKMSSGKTKRYLLYNNKLS